MGTLGFHHMAIRVRDLAKAEQFYTVMLGLSVLERHADDAGANRSIWLSAPPGILMLEREEGTAVAETAPEHRQRGLFLVAFSIPRSERSTWRARLKAKGIAIERETSYSLYLRDPEGNRLALSHYPDSAEGQG